MLPAVRPSPVFPFLLESALSLPLQSLPSRIRSRTRLASFLCWPAGAGGSLPSTKAFHQSIPPVVKLSNLWRSDKKVPATRSAPPANRQAGAGGDFRCCNTSLPPILRHCFNQPVHPADDLLRVILVVKGTQLWMARMKAIATRVVWPPLSCSMSLRGSESPANVTRGGKFSGRLQLLLF